VLPPTWKPRPSEPILRMWSTAVGNGMGTKSQLWCVPTFFLLDAPAYAPGPGVTMDVLER
jgi:hypothetical protein